MKIKLYQVNMDRDVNNVCFMGFDRLEKYQGSLDVDSGIYDLRFEANMPVKTLEGLFTALNVDHPPEYATRSLSVSDVVQVVEGGDEKPGFYFCDSIGFKEVAFDPEKALTPDRKTIRVVMVEPEKEARVVNLVDELPALQNAVRGQIETMYPFEDEVAIVCNEEGKVTGLPLNRAVYMEGEMIDIIAGNFFICATPADSEGFESLTEEQVNKYLEAFKAPERFYRGWDGSIQVEKVKRPLAEAIEEYRNSVTEAKGGRDTRGFERDD